MAQKHSSLGKVIAIFAVEPAYIQRAVITVVLAFLFFLGTMLAYYVFQSFAFFLLSTAFLIIYIVMLLSLVLQRRLVLQVSERGIFYKNASIRWSDIAAVDDDGTLSLPRGRKVVLASSLHHREEAVRLVQKMAASARPADS